MLSVVIVLLLVVWIGMVIEYSLCFSLCDISVQFCLCMCVSLVFSVLIVCRVCGVQVWKVWFFIYVVSVLLVRLVRIVCFIEVVNVGSCVFMFSVMFIIWCIGMCSMQMMLVLLSMVIEQFLLMWCDSCFRFCCVSLVRFNEVRQLQFSFSICGVRKKLCLWLFMQFRCCSVSSSCCVIVCDSLVCLVICDRFGLDSL